MNIKKILCLFLICGAANAHNIDPAKCNNEIQQDDVYWCLMDKYQQSVIALKKEEINAQKRLERFDKNEGKERKEALMKMGLLHTILTFTLQE
ncbi:hypothetical protein [Salmonella enterica]|uniref:hypothetical protein n=1 Tax=Salmonella enterica TaxID=28901 RepID=UPI000AA3B3C3|nr:hypothetical protein [Salmonella enterica]